MKKYTDSITVKLASLLNRVTKSKLRPNHLTIICLILHFPLAYLIIKTHLIYAGIGLVLVASIDALDGALARVQNKATDFGGWLDASSDRIKEIIIFCSLIYYLNEIDSSSLELSLAGAVLGLSIVVSYIKAKAETIMSAYSKVSYAKLNKVFASGLASYQFRVIILSLALVLNQITVGLLIIAILALITIIQRSCQFYKSLKSVKISNKK